jgi:hypothetical protein
MVPLNVMKGGFDLPPEDEKDLNVQKAITAKINAQFIQVGACWLKPSGKDPLDKDWFGKKRGDVDLQGWIDQPDFQRLNVGFNLQLGWLDIDIDSSDTEYVRCIQHGLRHVGVDTRFAFGRRSRGVASHFLVQLPEDEAASYDFLRRFEPRPVAFRGERYHTQLRSFTPGPDKAAERTAKQTVVPGSVYSRKFEHSKEYDISVWYNPEGEARSVQDVAVTTARRTDFRSIVRGVAFGTVLYCVHTHWVEGNRQAFAVKFTGWLARVVEASAALNDQEAIASDVFCPVASDQEAESLVDFIAHTMGDEEAAMRKRAYRDAREKLSRNPDAKVPGWHSMVEAIGEESVQALRAVLTPGSDMSKLTELAERYIYDETDDLYIDRTRHGSYGKFAHGAFELERRHKGDTIFVGGKPKAAFNIFEGSNLRRRVGTRDMYPELSAGGIYRIDSYGNPVPDEYDARATTVFNTWAGWPIQPAGEVDAPLIKKAIDYLDKLLGYLTRDDPAQIAWFKQWVAWTFQHPGIKQQVAPVFVGEQGVGKSFLGNVFMRALFTEQLWGTASPNVIDQKFNVGPFKDKIFVFIDEARFKTDTVTDEVKKLIRNVSVSGMEKFEEARTYRVFARVCFAANHFNVHIGEKDTRDRTLFYMRTVDPETMGITRPEFEAWARGLKPWFDEFDQFLKRPEVIQQYVRYFVDLPVTKQEIENVAISSSTDKAVLESNVSWFRRIIRGILESGWIADSGLDWSTPFDKASLISRIQLEAKAQGLGPPNTSVVLREFELVVPLDNITEPYRNGNVRRMRTRNNWATCIDQFVATTHLEIHAYREFVPSDHGVNDSKSVPPKERLGAKPDLMPKF